ncbi:MAG: KilA-N domain-containing protein [Bacteroidales bacterium]|jgi:hypothetical protein|nr:KilA-N domain-containing protein [Bacteroidales bacterium]
MAKITVRNTELTVVTINNAEYICITDLARFKNPEHTDDVIRNWLRNRNTIELLGIWETLHNPDFNPVIFDGIRKEVGLNAFVMTPKRWIESTNAIGIISKTGRYGGTYAHRDIALEFASWISIEFKLYLLKEFQRLKEEEQKTIGWSAKRELAKINYHIHTDAIKHNLVPAELTPQQTSIIYASEADVLNVALFGTTAAAWREANPDLKGNIRDYATINELICLSNMEMLCKREQSRTCSSYAESSQHPRKKNINAVLINDNVPQRERLIKLNQIAIQQMRVLADVEGRKLLR